MEGQDQQLTLTGEQRGVHQDMHSKWGKDDIKGLPE
jgi:hypothetical protein